MHKAAKNVNGRLLSALAREAKFHDSECAQSFREGCDIIGKLTCTGNGRRLENVEESPVGELRASRLINNRALLESLREDSNAAVLYKMTCEDAALGRMSRPRPVRESDLKKYTLSPRFCIEQGTHTRSLHDETFKFVACYRNT